MNPKSPNIRGLIKFHKQNAPIRPIINWQQAPAYKIAKLLSDRLKHELKLPFTFNVINSPHIMTEIQNIEPYNQNLRLASFDITNMYTNIPTSQLPSIINNICKFQNTPQETRRELIKITNTIIKQNYFSFLNNTYRQTDGLAMGAPTSALLSEIYLQYIEHTLIANILINHKI
jgi:hypothetical protein